MRLLLIAVLMTFAAAGCTTHDHATPPGMFPAIETTRMPGNLDCPDLRGVFSAVIASGSDARLARIGGLSEPGASVIQITQQGGSVQVATWWPADRVRWDARALASRSDVLYRIWWNAARDVLSRVLVPGTDAVARASSLPEPTAVRAALVEPECTDGWMKYASSTYLARDVDGGLVVRHDVEIKQIELPLMCGGDGCRGIPLYRRYESRWARHPAATLPATWSMDFAQLPTPEGAVDPEGTTADARDVDNEAGTLLPIGH